MIKMRFLKHIIVVFIGVFSSCANEDPIITKGDHRMINIEAVVDDYFIHCKDLSGDYPEVVYGVSLRVLKSSRSGPSIIAIFFEEEPEEGKRINFRKKNSRVSFGIREDTFKMADFTSGLINDDFSLIYEGALIDVTWISEGKDIATIN